MQIHHTGQRCGKSHSVRYGSVAGQTDEFIAFRDVMQKAAVVERFNLMSKYNKLFVNVLIQIHTYFCRSQRTYRAPRFSPRNLRTASERRAHNDRFAARKSVRIRWTLIARRASTDSDTSLSCSPGRWEKPVLIRNKYICFINIKLCRCFQNVVLFKKTILPYLLRILRQNSPPLNPYQREVVHLWEINL